MLSCPLAESLLQKRTPVLVKFNPLIICLQHLNFKFLSPPIQNYIKNLVIRQFKGYNFSCGEFMFKNLFKKKLKYLNVKAAYIYLKNKYNDAFYLQFF